VAIEVQPPPQCVFKYLQSVGQQSVDRHPVPDLICCGGSLTAAPTLDFYKTLGCSLIDDFINSIVFAGVLGNAHADRLAHASLVDRLVVDLH
jgi:hypothetical protein